MSQPSRTELTILKTLWETSPLSAREIQDKIGPALDWSFSTTRTTLSRMAEKGLLTLDKKHGIRVYAPSQSKAHTLSSVMRDFFETVLEIKGPLPTAAFHNSEMLTEDEWAELEAHLNTGRDDD